MLAFGLPKEIVSDNGPQFTSSAFSELCAANGVVHTLSPPYHPNSNGLAERFVRTFKDALNEHKKNGGDVMESVDLFLSNYRSTPHAATSKSPAELMFSRPIRCKMSIILTNPRTQAETKEVPYARRFAPKIVHNKKVISWDILTKLTQ